MNSKIISELEWLRKINTEIKLENTKLKIRSEELSHQLANYEHRLSVLIKQTDEWAKSYDNLLKDFISYRNGTR